MQDIISGKVAAVIDDTTLVLNLGSKDGVREGMLFAIVVECQELKDPDSGESLGDWEMVKARVIVDHVQDAMCTVRSPLMSERDRPGTLSAMMVQHSLGNFGGRYGQEREHLEIRLSDTSGRPQSQPIAVGDGARLITTEGAPEVDSSQTSEQPPEAVKGASSASDSTEGNATDSSQ